MQNKPADFATTISHALLRIISQPFTEYTPNLWVSTHVILSLCLLEAYKNNNGYDLYLWDILNWRWLLRFYITKWQQRHKWQQRIDSEPNHSLLCTVRVSPSFRLIVFDKIVYVIGELYIGIKRDSCCRTNYQSISLFVNTCYCFWSR